ncbi:hypothetical protein HPB50_002876 [Hyalomma asiaticum]|uniref:Uncharacterized protein n=1 Tax=Hyalomma asiaticum TaxID=266040 RepID=A0ACB7SDZ4_HYAAI|nr:hypothetical protein HPB50_002876 [Hyalomma asiaticum]
MTRNAAGLSRITKRARRTDRGPDDDRATTIAGRSPNGNGHALPPAYVRDVVADGTAQRPEPRPYNSAQWRAMHGIPLLHMWRTAAAADQSRTCASRSSLSMSQRRRCSPNRRGWRENATGTRDPRLQERDPDP